MDYTLRVHSQEFSISRQQAQQILQHAKEAGTLTVLSRYRGHVCYELGRTQATNLPAFIMIESP